MSMSRGEFAQATMDVAVQMDPRKDNELWGIMVAGPIEDGENDYEHVVFDPSIRESTTKEAELYGKKAIDGGYKLTISGAVELLPHTWGVVGPLSEDMVIVRGTDKTDVDGRTIIADAETYNILHIHPLKNDGVVQEYWVFVNTEIGGTSRGL